MQFSKVSLLSIAFFLLLQACGLGAKPPAAPSTTDPASTVSTVTPARAFELYSIPLRSGFGFRSEWFELYFTDPTSSFSAEKSGGLDGPVAASIVAARESVDVALNSLGVNSIMDALIRAHKRGITVRVVIETNNMLDRLNPQQLRDAGIPIVDDNANGMMNNTFVIIDHEQVWTGSLTYTSSGLFKSDNDLVRIYSKEIADNYTKEFEEMFTYGQFGAYVVPETPNPSVMIEGTQVEVLFSPDDVVLKRLSELLGEAQESIYFMAYSMSSSTLGSLIRDRAAQGIDVAGIMEASQLDTDGTTEFDLFRQAGLDIRLANQSEVMNHKVMIIDGKIVVMGSYDFTDRAETENDENILILYNEMIAQKFMEEFQRLQSRAQP